MTQLYLWEMGTLFRPNWIRFISAKSCSVDFPVSKLILKNTLSWFINTQLFYKTVQSQLIQNLNLLYKKIHCLVETEKCLGCLISAQLLIE
jgi:hypothetical protein